jgi:carbonic anhydrase
MALLESNHQRSTPAATTAFADSMRRLHEGNARFVNQTATNPRRDAARRGQIAYAQHPFAIVLGCSDSRVPPEIVFDQGLGDLFVIRVAGKVSPPAVLGSIEYAVEHPGCRTIVVLGHERCGAVEAALNAPPDLDPEGNLGGVIKAILPGIEQVDRQSPDALDAAVFANARAVATGLVSGSKMLSELLRRGEIQITPARYDLDTGVVEFLDPIGPAPEA